MSEWALRGDQGNKAAKLGVIIRMYQKKRRKKKKVMLPLILQITCSSFNLIFFKKKNQKESPAFAV